MSEATDKLTEMFDNSINQSSAIDDSTSQIEIQIAALEEQRDAIQEGILDKSATDMEDYLQYTKIPELGYSQSEAYVAYGVIFGVTTILNWVIKDSTSEAEIYRYNGAGWDGDERVLELESDFQFGYDYIHHSNGTSGTYGLQGQIAVLYIGLNLLIANKNKYDDSRNVFQKYMTS